MNIPTLRRRNCPYQPHANKKRQANACRISLMIDKDKSEPHRRMTRLGSLISIPDIGVPTLSAGAGDRT